MQHITAIGFDLFETLVLVHHLRREEAVGRLLQSLTHSGVPVVKETFVPIYRATARRFMATAQDNGEETHNRFWISTALQECGHAIHSEDSRIAQAVERYFSAFVDYATPIPGTPEMLAQLRQRYRLGLVSNLTHAPAALSILDKLGLTPFFDTILVSGEVGYRKPHPKIFSALLEALGTSGAQTAFVGDNLDADVRGAQQAGMQPIWMAYTQAQGLTPPTPTPPRVPTITNWQELNTLLAVPTVES
jgi:putative hydrolase of the HAD superfamily